MKKMFNERHMKIDNSASHLDILRELNKRGALDEDLNNYLKHLDGKEKGLKIVMDVLEKYAKEHWIYMTDVALDHYGYVHCNLMVMTSTHLYTLEINHFEGDYTFKEGVSYLNGEQIDKEPLLMVQSVSSQLKSNIKFCHVPIKLQVTGAAIFTHTDCTIDIQDETKKTEIVMSHQIENFVKKMVRDEKKAGGKLDIIPNHISWLIRIDRHHPYHQLNVPDHIIERVQSGVTCIHCESFDVQVGEIFSVCACGGTEFAEQTIVRTICDYGVINQNKELDSHELHHFFNNQVSLKQIKEQLNRYFVPIW